jgi:cytochrome c biogenesis protein ResB
VWQLLTNVKFALVLVGTAAFAGLLGVVLPQMPGPMRSNAAARSAWLELQRQDFGVFTGPMERAGLFDVFHSTWFNGLWVLIIVAVTVCTVSRFRPTWKSVQHPTRVVGDGYFARAHHNARFTQAGGVEAVERLLRKKRYKVERTKSGDDGSVYLFAERFSWSQYGTFLSHLALLMLLIGALLTTLAGFDKTFVLAEGTPAAPVFDNPGPNQIFVKMLDAVRGKDTNGNIVDFHSRIEVRQGDKTITCDASVNTPCKAFGYKVHQAAYFNDIARLHVPAPDGSVAYSDVLDFDSESTAIPVLKVTDASGAVLFNQDLPQMDTDTGTSAGPEDDLAVGYLAFPKSRTAAAGDDAHYVVAWRVVKGNLQLALSRSDDNTPHSLDVGQSLKDDGYNIEFQAAKTIPAIKVVDMPGAMTDDGSATVEMPSDGAGNPYLYVTGVDLSAFALTQGNAVTAQNGYSYRFDGQVEASGVSVKRDPGSTFIWVAVGMAMAGLAITFYVPRRRLWVKITEGRTLMAGVAERTTRFSRELRLMGAELGAKDALQPGDIEEP